MISWKKINVHVGIVEYRALSQPRGRELGENRHLARARVKSTACMTVEVTSLKTAEVWIQEHNFAGYSDWQQCEELLLSPGLQVVICPRAERQCLSVGTTVRLLHKSQQLIAHISRFMQMYGEWERLVFGFPSRAATRNIWRHVLSSWPDRIIWQRYILALLYSKSIISLSR
jgi:hypothetical protein